MAVLTFWQPANLLSFRQHEDKGLSGTTMLASHVPCQIQKEGTTMEMLLMGLCWTVFGLGVAAVAFGAATRSESPDSGVQPQVPNIKAVPTRFFSDSIAAPQSISSPRVPVDVLLLQIEKHVRLEQAAAESFIEFPTEAHLHSKTSSPLVN